MIATQATGEIKINAKTNNPDQAWSSLSVKVKKIPCDHLPLDLPIYKDKVNNLISLNY